MYQHMLIDARNAIYRAVYAGYNDKKFKESGADYFLIFLKFMNHYLGSFHPKQIHIFWDDHKDKLWRREICEEYKGTREINADIDPIIKRQVKLAVIICKSLGFRQYFQEGQEADDLIYAFCRCTSDPSIIISSDSDLKQIIYFMGHTALYNPLSKERKSTGVVAIDLKPEHDPTIYKALVGDKTDNVIGYYGVGPVWGHRYTINPTERLEFLKSNKAIVAEGAAPIGDERYKRNRRLVDLSLNPHLLDNMTYVERQMVQPAKFAYKDVIVKARDLGAHGIVNEADRYVVPFANLI